VERLRTRYEVHFDEGLFERKGFLAGSDERRLAEIRGALSDDSVRAIIAARGGYGATRLLDRLSADEVRNANKLLVGFSDMTALHALWARARLRSIHGPMIASFGDHSTAFLQRWIATVEGAVPEPLIDLRPMAPGRASGPLVGGNLAVLAALAGTPYAPPLAGSILFLEDVGERPYRVDRMLTTLLHAGWFEKISGILLGAFTDAPPGPDGVTIWEVLGERLGNLGLPVLAGVPAGHIDDNLELPFGSPTAMDAEAATVTFLEGAVRP